MKRLDLLCTSPSSTATLSHRHHSPRRWKPHLHDVVPCSSGQFFHPKTHFQYQKMPRKKMEKNEHRRKSSADAGDLNGPPLGSSSGRHSFSGCSSEPKRTVSWKDDFGVRKSTTSPAPPLRAWRTDKSPAPTSSGSTGGDFQEVVLYVSLHCKGCEEKVRKHISRIEGVKSFSIDLAAKKVTIIGDVSPLNVLSSISKVKRAHLWPSPPSIQQFK